MKCKEVMNYPVWSCSKDASIGQCAQMMRDYNVGMIRIADGEGRTTGVVTDRDIVLRAIAEGKSLATKVGEIMSDSLITCHADDDLHEAEARMVESHKSRILVTNGDGTCAGVISLADIGQVESKRRAGKVLGGVTERESRLL